MFERGVTEPGRIGASTGPFSAAQELTPVIALHSASLRDGRRLQEITVSVDRFPVSLPGIRRRLLDIPVATEAQRYYTKGPEGQKRIDLQLPEITATLDHVEASIARFTVVPGESHQKLMRDKGLQTSEEVRDFLLGDTTGVHYNRAGDIALPYPYMASNDGYFAGQLYYWDSADHIKMMLADPQPSDDRMALAKGTIEDFAYLFDLLQHIPNASNKKVESRSQPPLLTTMVMDIYAAMVRRDGKATPESKKWLQEKMEFAKREYWEVWNTPQDNADSSEPVIPHNHTVSGTMLRTYGDTDVGYHPIAECESGEDMTPRFEGRAHDFFAVDLNAKLALYEKHFEKEAALRGDNEEVAFWKDRRERRVQEMMDTMWDEETGWMYDYDHKNKRRSPVPALAGFFAVTAGILPPDKVDRMTEKLPEFIQPYGVTLTPKEYPEEPELGRQWAYPNDFANRKRQVVEGLVAYGKFDEAIEIMERSIIGYAEFYKRYGTLPEKINAVTGGYGDGAKYPKQQGFGWTNAAFLEFTKLLPIVYEARDRQKQQDIQAVSGPIEVFVQH